MRRNKKRASKKKSVQDEITQEVLMGQSIGEPFHSTMPLNDFLFAGKIEQNRPFQKNRQSSQPFSSQQTHNSCNSISTLCQLERGASSSVFQSDNMMTLMVERGDSVQSIEQSSSGPNSSASTPTNSLRRLGPNSSVASGLKCDDIAEPRTHNKQSSKVSSTTSDHRAKLTINRVTRAESIVAVDPTSGEQKKEEAKASALPLPQDKKRVLPHKSKRSHDKIALTKMTAIFHKRLFEIIQSRDPTATIEIKIKSLIDTVKTFLRYIPKPSSKQVQTDTRTCIFDLVADANVDEFIGSNNFQQQLITVEYLMQLKDSPPPISRKLCNQVVSTAERWRLNGRRRFTLSEAFAGIHTLIGKCYCSLASCASSSYDVATNLDMAKRSFARALGFWPDSDEALATLATSYHQLYTSFQSEPGTLRHSKFCFSAVNVHKSSVLSPDKKRADATNIPFHSAENGHDDFEMLRQLFASESQLEDARVLFSMACRIVPDKAKYVFGLAHVCSSFHDDRVRTHGLLAMVEHCDGGHKLVDEVARMRTFYDSKSKLSKAHSLDLTRQKKIMRTHSMSKLEEIHFGQKYAQASSSSTSYPIRVNDTGPKTIPPQPPPTKPPRLKKEKKEDRFAKKSVAARFGFKRRNKQKKNVSKKQQNTTTFANNTNNPPPPPPVAIGPRATADFSSFSSSQFTKEIVPPPPPTPPPAYAFR